MSSEILEKTLFFERFCCLRLLAVKQLRKNQFPGGKHHASEGRASSKTTPKNSLTCRLKSWKTTFLERFCCLRRLAVKQLRKNQLPGGKHHASEGRASSKTTPKNSLTCRLKSYRKTTFFERFCCLRLLAVKQLRKNQLPGGKHHASEGRASSKTTPKNSRTSGKTTFFEMFCCLRLLPVKQLRKNQLPGGKHHASEGRASSKTTPKNSLTCRLKKNNIFRKILLPAAASSKTASKKSAPGGKTPCL